MKRTKQQNRIKSVKGNRKSKVDNSHKIDYLDKVMSEAYMS